MSRSRRRHSQNETRARRLGPALPNGAVERPIPPQQLAQQSNALPRGSVVAAGLPAQTANPYQVGSALQGTNSLPAEYYAPRPQPGVGPQGMAPGTRPPAVAFAPGDPIRPGRGLDDGYGGPRTWSYPTGVNITTMPRSTEGYGFAQLRNLAEIYYGVQLCEEVIFRILDRLQLQVVPRPDFLRADEGEDAERWLGPGRQMRDWFLQPHRGLTLREWMRAAMRELLELDALGVYHEVTRAGYLLGLRLIAGDTLVRFVDTTGNMPLAPYPAFLQITNGAPAWLGTCADMDYLRINARAGSLYGRPPVEQILLNVNLVLRKLSYDLTHFTDGSTPEGMMTTSEPDLMKLSADQVMEYERGWNAVLAGNDAMRVRTKFAPPGWNWSSTKPQDFATALDEYQMGVCIAAFGLTKDELGITDTSNRSTGAKQEDVIYRNAVRPRTDFFADYFSRLIARYDGTPIAAHAATISRPKSATKPAKGVWDARYFVRFDGIDEPEDWNQRAFALKALAQGGIVSPTQVKHMLKIPVLPGEQPIPPYILAPAGATSVVFPGDLAAQRDKINAAHGQTLDAQIQQAQQGVTQGANQTELSNQAIEKGKVDLAAAKHQLAQAKANPQPPPEPPQGPDGPPARPKPPAGPPGASGSASTATSATKPSPNSTATPKEPANARGDEPEPRGRPYQPDRGLDRDAGWDALRAPGDGLGASVPDRGQSATDASGSPSGERTGSARSGAGAERASLAARDGGRRGGDLSSVAREQYVGAGDGRDARDSTGGSRSESTGAASRAGSGSGADPSGGTSGATSSTSECAREWQRWREKALKAVKAGRAQPRFDSDVLPADEATWVSEHLSDAITPDAVRAVFERQRLGQWSEDEPLQAAFAPESELARAEPPSANTKADPLDALASALVDRLSVVTTASATASATAAAIEQSISQGRELRALVMRAIGGM